LVLKNTSGDETIVNETIQNITSLPAKLIRPTRATLPAVSSSSDQIHNDLKTPKYFQAVATQYPRDSYTCSSDPNFFAAV
jgi:hypothetical protein